jgi:phosphomannomutase
MNKTIVMFDMDGTLTEPRQSFDYALLGDSLYQLVNCGVHIGIITGSDEDYLREQMGEFLLKSSARYKTHLMPCNGTKYFRPPKFANEDFKLNTYVSMKKALGVDNYRKLIEELILSQVHMSSYGIPLTGHFINCRGSLINWCPIGRNADDEERAIFKTLDKTEGIREKVIDELKAMLEQKGLLRKLTIKFGGDTSFDIYPKGWDKTYGLRHFRNWDVWFVGDRCDVGGNDYEIFEACDDKGYITAGPEHTKEIIDNIVMKLRDKP